MYDELSDTTVRNNNTYKSLNNLLCLNYAISETISFITVSKSSKSSSVKRIPFSLKEIKEFIQEHMYDYPNLISLINGLNIEASELNTIDIDQWNNYIGYDSHLLKLFDDYDQSMESLFNNINKEINRVIPEYSKIFATTVGITFTEKSMHKTLFTYKEALSEMFSTKNKNFNFENEEARRKLLDYMFYYLGFDVIKLDKNKIIFNISSGAINENVAEFLLTLKENKGSKSIYELIVELNDFIFIGDKDGGFFNNVFLKDILGEKLNITAFIKNEYSPKVEIGEDKLRLITLNNVITMKKALEKGISIDTSMNKEMIFEQLDKIIDMCVMNLEQHTFFSKFVEYLLLKK